MYNLIEADYFDVVFNYRDRTFKIVFETGRTGVHTSGVFCAGDFRFQNYAAVAV